MKKLYYCTVLMFLAFILVSCVYKTYRLDEDEVKEALTGTEISDGNGSTADISAPGEECCPKGDIIACVMVDGELYFDTGRVSTVNRCGVMDGNIDSDIGSNRLPEKNNQSNFGTGYGYQYGAEGTIDILIDDEWRIFATAPAKEKLLSEHLDASFNDDTFTIVQNTVCEVGKGTLKSAVRLSDEDAEALRSLLSGNNWDESGTTDCESNISVNLGGQLYYYHSECGMFNKYDLSILSLYSHAEPPQDLGKSLILTESDKAKVNGILEKYVSLSPSLADSIK